MANVIVTLQIMPDSPDADITAIDNKATALIAKFGGEVGKRVTKEVAFGLKSLDLVFVMDEAKGSTESLEKEIAQIEHVNSVNVTDVRRAIG
jgi:translation elongation factor aEF-1 beta